MKTLAWFGLFLVGTLVYGVLVWLLGFPGFLAYAVHFGRVAIAVAVLTIYVPVVSSLFREVPAPRRDYLLAGILLTWLSSMSFAIWNEMGILYGVQTSIFVSPIAGFFSLILVVGGLFHYFAPGVIVGHRRYLALALGIAAGIFIVLLPLLLGRIS